jgi:hypothetical protein
MEKLRRHWMAIPIGVAAPFWLALIIGGNAAGWHNEVIGSLFLLIFAIVVTVGTLAAPIDSD